MGAPSFRKNKQTEASSSALSRSFHIAFSGVRVQSLP